MPPDARVPCIILAGGLGTRLSAVLPNTPKCLAPVHGRPFLAYQIDSLVRRGVTDFVLSLGHLAQQVEAAVDAMRRPGIRIDCVIEPAPLGTGGAVLHAMQVLGVSEALVANGDTLLDGSLDALSLPLTVLPPAPSLVSPGSSPESTSRELVRMATVLVEDRSRFGSVVTDAAGRVMRFLEKGHAGAGWINAGFYRVHVEAFGPTPLQGAFSFETTTLPRLAADRALVAARIDGELIDIGVPSEYRRFCDSHAAR